MEEEKNVQAENSTQQEEEVLETSNEESNEEESEELKKYKELAQNYKIRAEKAERLAKTPKSEPIKKQEAPIAGELKPKDVFTLMEAKVSQDDIDEVLEYANFKKISVGEALKSVVLKQILSEKNEQRNVANATNVSSSKRTSNKVTDESLLEKAKKGEFSDNDEDLLRLMRARKGYKN